MADVFEKRSSRAFGCINGELKYMNAEYWRRRCEAAEDALRRSRSRLWISPSRHRILSTLAELKADQAMTTDAVSERVGLKAATAAKALSILEEAGLIDRATQ